MKKINGYLIIGFCFFCIVASCTKEDELSVTPVSELEDKISVTPVGKWEAIEIGGAIDGNGKPLEINGSVSTIELLEDGSYTFFLHAKPWYYLDGDGEWSMSETAINFTGILDDLLGVTTVNMSNSSSKMEFFDDDDDKWVFLKK